MGDLRSELSVIPGWARLIALVIVLGTPIGLATAVAIEVGFLGLFVGSLLAALVLAIGYVNGDAKRRGMNPTHWTLIALFVPNAIGILLYFLLREPLRSPCPSCGRLAQPAFNFCPSCHHALKPVCSACGKALAAEDTFCPYCGQKTSLAA